MNIIILNKYYICLIDLKVIFFSRIYFYIVNMQNLENAADEAISLLFTFNPFHVVTLYNFIQKIELVESISIKKIKKLRNGRIALFYKEQCNRLGIGE